MSNQTAFVSRSPIKMLESYLASFLVANGVTIPVGVYCMLPGSGGDTANRGYLDNYQNIATAIFVGFCNGPGNPGDLSTSNTIVGNTSPGSGKNVPRASCELGAHVLLNYPVIGASAQTDVGKKVWLANNNDVTLTQNLTGVVGRVINYTSATQEDVLMYGMIGSDLLTS